MTVEEIIEKALAHHGVKGQRWGVRRVRAHIDSVNAEARKPKSVVVKTNPTKTRKKIQTSGGENQPAHADAIATRSKQQVLKKSGIDSLSNKDLQEIQTRLNLEANVSRLDKAQRLSGQHFVARFLKDPKGRKQLSSMASSEEAKAVGKALRKSPAGVRLAGKVTKTAVKVGLAAA